MRNPMPAPHVSAPRTTRSSASLPACRMTGTRLRLRPLLLFALLLGLPLLAYTHEEAHGSGTSHIDTPVPTEADGAEQAWPFDAEEAQRRQREAAAQWGISVARTVRIRHEVEMEFVLIPPGTFMMGSPDTEPGRLPERGENRRRVTITRPFYMAKYPVTQRQWLVMTGSNPSHFHRLGGSYPVDMICWNAATNRFLPLMQAYAPKGMRFALPTEAQWEYACRAGTATAYAFGDTLTREHANVDNPHQQPTPVGTYPANAWGLHDMHGNIWEWCRDTFHADAYTVTAAVDPLEERPSRHHVLRGGSWRARPEHARSAIRGRSYTERDYIYFGFRPVLELEGDGLPEGSAAPTAPSVPLQDASADNPDAQETPGTQGKTTSDSGTHITSSPDDNTHDKEPAE